MSTLTVGTISEKVTDAGVTVDSLNIKDGALNLAVAQKANTKIRLRLLLSNSIG